ncbi:MAG: ATP-grasp domain-containing protein [Alphaproteobacteria bacterium]|nr:ATP-grasp domain-containing protein [Alphaproteobacteria bacterium]
MTQRILLATTVKWPSAAYLAGAFASLGCPVEALFPRGHVLAVSKYLSRAHTYQPLRPLVSLATAIARAGPDLIIPCDDRAVTILQRLRAMAPELSALLERSMGRMDSYPLMMTRSNAIAVARSEGVTAPLTVPVADEVNLKWALESVGLPAVLKTDGSWGGGVAVVRTHEEATLAFRKLGRAPSRLRSMARAVVRKDAHFLLAAYRPRAAAVHLQQFINGKPATSAFACRDGEILAAIHVDVVAWQGTTGPASLLKRTDCPQMDNAARRIARRFGLNGLQGLDFVRDEAGTAHLIEINPRATQICHLALGAGHDLPAALLGQPPRPAVTDKQLIALFPQEWRRNPAEQPPATAYRDVPWDDPAVLAAVGGVQPLFAPHADGRPFDATALRARRSES